MKCDHRITGLYSRRKHLFYRDNQSSRIISLPERDRKRGQEQIRKNTDKIIWIGGRGAAGRRGYLQLRRAVLFAIFSGCGTFLY